MEAPSRQETKKAVCRSFTHVILKSPLNGAIDPKAFVLLLNTQFTSLYRNGKFHLAPLWDALQAERHPTDSLLQLFLEFETAAKKLGIQVEQAPNVVALSPETRGRLHVPNMAPNGEQDPSGFTPLFEVEMIDGAIEAIPLHSSDIKPLIPEDLKRRVNQAVVQSIRSTPIGTKIDPVQVGMWVDGNFEKVFDGLRFDFSPLVPALREVPDVVDLDIFVAAHRLKELLQPMSVEMELPALEVDLKAAAEVIAQSQLRRSSAISDPRAQAVTHQPVHRANTPVSLPALTDEPAPAPKEEKGRRRLAKWGLGRSRLSEKAQLIQRAVLAVALVVAGAIAFLNRDDRPLDVSDFTEFPLANARLADGTFQGQVDEARWHKLKYKQREEAVAKLEANLKERGLIQNLQIRDSKGRLVITAVGSGKISPASALLRDNLPAGDTPPPPPTPPAPPKGSKKAAPPSPK